MPSTSTWIEKQEHGNKKGLELAISHTQIEGTYYAKTSHTKGCIGKLWNATNTPFAPRHSRIRSSERSCRHSAFVYLIVMSLMSKISLEFAGIPGAPFLPYPSCDGMVIRRSPPAAMPAMPMSIPLITSPPPSLKVRGFPFLLAIDRLVRYTHI